MRPEPRHRMAFRPTVSRDHWRQTHFDPATCGLLGKPRTEPVVAFLLSLFHFQHVLLDSTAAEQAVNESLRALGRMLLIARPGVNYPFRVRTENQTRVERNLHAAAVASG